MDVNKYLKDRKAYSRYGADMGRRTVQDDPTGLHLQRVRLDSGGYDPGGAYWGTPSNLFCAFRPDGEFQMFTRANSREQAKNNVILATLGAARFKR